MNQSFSFDNGGTPWDTENTAIGYWSMALNQPDSATDGYRDTAVGSQSLYNNSTGSHNVALGYRAGYNLTSGNYNIDLASEGVAGEGNTIRIGDSNQTSTYISGIFGTTIPGGKVVVVDSTGHLGVQSGSIATASAPPGLDSSPALLAELKKQRATIAAQAQAIDELKAQLVRADEEHRQQLSALLARLAKLEAGVGAAATQK